ncbi:SDR family NAD(P)-dependent oxidoreductase [Streptococcus catagoni]|uniref:SDR family NAD(P)-dependent oxidoreductase n=1 Tax=Streptococcus catagoni TaxID=2654874 RepID=UPI00140B82BA|nr:SDR family oxidoreductase [Streptococcus catagoni]
MAERIILITGASGGLAEEIVKQLPEEDFLLLVGRSKEKLEKLYADRPNKRCIGMDIKDVKAIEKTVDLLWADFGHIDILINNAGFGDFKTFDHFTSQQIEEMFEVNTLASIHFARLLGKKMASLGRGHIVNIISIAGLIASSKSTIYSATKFAMIGFSNALRLELADQNVYVTSINPGPIATKFFDQADPSGQYLKSVGKLTLKPEKVAARVIAILGKNKREVNLPFTLALTHKFYTLFPRISDFLARKVFNYK